MNAIEQELSQIPHFQYIHPQLFTSAQPSPEQLTQIKAYGVDTVLNLAIHQDAPEFEHQDQYCLEIGLNYLQIPLDWAQPPAEQCLFVLDLISHFVKDKVVWVYCNNNKRVSSLMYLYRQYYMGIDLVTAQQQLHQIWEPDNTWTSLIHGVGLLLQGRRSTEELEQALQQSQDQDQDQDQDGQ